MPRLLEVHVLVWLFCGYSAPENGLRTTVLNYLFVRFYGKIKCSSLSWSSDSKCLSSLSDLESLKSTLDLLHVEWDVKLLVFSFRATSEVDNATLLKQICVSHNERNVTKFVVVCGKW